MTVRELMASRTVRRWTGLLLLSAAFHAAVLGAFALRLPAGPGVIGLAPADVRLVPAPALVRWPTAPTAPPPPVARARLVVLDAAPRYAGAAQAATGEASDAVDLFGPVFSDGQWPRPILVRSEPCDPAETTERSAECRRELLLIGLASEPSAGSKAEP